MLVITNKLDEAQTCLCQGKLLAYPTEAVYGLGCDPFNQQAVLALLALKQRSLSKGLILLISNWSQLSPLIAEVPASLLAPVQESWPGPVTWLFPKGACIPEWLCGEHDSIAIRMTAHPIARALCLKAPLISTSANISGHLPARDVAGVCEQFPEGIDVIFDGPVGGASAPSCIYDVRSGERLR